MRRFLKVSISLSNSQSTSDRIFGNLLQNFQDFSILLMIPFNLLQNFQDFSILLTISFNLPQNFQDFSILLTIFSKKLQSFRCTTNDIFCLQLWVKVLYCAAINLYWKFDHGGENYSHAVILSNLKLCGTQTSYTTTNAQTTISMFYLTVEYGIHCLKMSMDQSRKQEGDLV